MKLKTRYITSKKTK